MKNVWQIMALFLVLISASAAGLATSKCQPEFDKIKSLVGVWVGKASDGNAIHVSYELISGGTAVLEAVEAGYQPHVVTVYYLDHDHLMLTHYCLANNQPRMRADASSSSTEAIKFTFVDATNLAGRDAGHMHAHGIFWKDSDHISEYWTWRQSGQEMVRTFELERRK